MTARVVLVVLAVLMVAAGALASAQAIGWTEGGAFEDSSLWAVLGPILAGLGVALLISVVQHRRQ